MWTTNAENPSADERMPPRLCAKPIKCETTDPPHRSVTLATSAVRPGAGVGSEVNSKLNTYHCAKKAETQTNYPERRSNAN